jgi:hypothetical protein
MSNIYILQLVDKDGYYRPFIASKSLEEVMNYFTTHQQDIIEDTDWLKDSDGIPIYSVDTVQLL